MSFIIIYTTNPNEKTAKKIAKHLLNKKLIACANFFSTQSMYGWNNSIENSKEVIAIYKTRKENWKKVKTEIEKIHPYEIPCIIKITAQANIKYFEWLYKETST